jgi:hypothetical protein
VTHDGSSRAADQDQTTGATPTLRTTPRICAVAAHWTVAAFVGATLLLAADQLSAKTYPPVMTHPNVPLQHYDKVSVARRHCPDDEVVWLRNDGTYLRSDEHGYGNAGSGSFVCRKEATGWGARPAYSRALFNPPHLP